MVDIGWVVLAFLCGGYTGMLLVAMLAISRQDTGRSKLAIPGLATAAIPASIGEEEDAATG